MSRSALVRGHGLRTGGRVRACRRGALLGALCLTVAAATARAQTPVGTLFTYQGRLMEAGSPANGTYDFRFQLYDAPDGGSQVGPTVTHDDAFVSTGLFQVPLNFGAVFAGQNRFLELAVRPGASTGPYETVSGRQHLGPTPQALFSLGAPWTGVAGKPPGFADDADNDALGALACASGQVAKWNGSAWACAADIDTDTNTTYTAGAGGGLVLIGTAFSITTAGVSTARLADGAVTSAKLADMSVTGSKIPTDTITAVHIASGAVGAAEIADNTVGSNEIADNSIGAAEIADNSITAAEILDGAVASAEILDGSVGSAEIGTAAVGASEIADGTVARADLGGTEVPLYQNVSECGSSALTLSATCPTTVCTSGPPPILFFQCNGSCGVPSSQTCPTTLRGYLLAPTIP